jgi:hypothetical protein
MILGTALGESTRDRAELQALDASNVRSVSPARSIDTGETSAVEGAAVQISVQPELTKWTKADARRFRELATKRATDDASSAEQEEFTTLQHRRRLHYLRSANEVISEWQRRRFASEVFALLNRNVTFFKAEDQARLRSLRQS